MAFMPFTKDERPTMEAFNERFQQAILEGGNLGVSVEVASYVGTATYGSGYPCSVTGSRPIVAALFLGYRNGSGIYYTPGVGNIPTALNYMIGDTLTTEYANRVGFFQVDSSDNTNTLFGKKSEDGKTFYWYTSQSYAAKQLNASGNTYYFLLFCK